MKVFSNEHRSLEHKMIFLKKFWVGNEMIFNKGKLALPSCMFLVSFPPGGWCKLNTYGTSRSPFKF